MTYYCMQLSWINCARCKNRRMIQIQQNGHRPVTNVMFGVSTLASKLSTTNDSWDFTPAVAVIVVILIIGFAVVAAGWVIKRDV